MAAGPLVSAAQNELYPTASASLAVSTAVWGPSPIRLAKVTPARSIPIRGTLSTLHPTLSVTTLRTDGCSDLSTRSGQDLRSDPGPRRPRPRGRHGRGARLPRPHRLGQVDDDKGPDRRSTRLNSSHKCPPLMP